MHTSDYDCGFPVDYGELTMFEGEDWMLWKDADGELHGPRFNWFDGTRSQLFMVICWDHGQMTGHGHKVARRWRQNRRARDAQRPE